MGYAITLIISLALGFTAYFLTRALTNWLSRSKPGAIQIKTGTGEQITIRSGDLSNAKVDEVIDAVLKDEIHTSKGRVGILRKFSGKAGQPWVIGIVVFGLASIVVSFFLSESRNGTILPLPPEPRLHGSPSDLFEIIKKQQRDYVKESYGESASQNFTQVDLATFQKKGVVAQIIDRLKHNEDFKEVVIAIKELPANEQQELLEQASNTFKPTWAELGRISREGQTEAGQKAEQMIANAVVGLVKELLLLPNEDIEKISSE